MVSTAIPRSTSTILDTRPKYYLVEVPRRVAFTNCPSNMDAEDDNPFRPGSELSREAEIIVNLIKEGKPITPTGDMTSANEIHQLDSQIAKRNQTQTQAMFVNKTNDDNSNNINNKSTTAANNGLEPGQVDQVQHGIIVPSNNENQPKVEQINLKKKRKCCSIQ